MNGRLIAAALPVAPANDSAERLASLFDAHYDRLYRLARRLVPTADDALDLVQETFLRAARSPKSIPVAATDEEAWLVRVLINLRRDQWRKVSVRNSHAQDLGAGTLASNTGRDSEDVLITKTTVWQALDLLPPRRRAVVVMHELEGLTIAAIASLLGISTITARWHLSKGKHDLARALKPYMGDINEHR
jgi:RNA polymerase sigma-70 factor (ECF subfamily)